jgi:hypothetical protein
VIAAFIFGAARGIAMSDVIDELFSLLALYRRTLRAECLRMDSMIQLPVSRSRCFA